MHCHRNRPPTDGSGFLPLLIPRLPLGKVISRTSPTEIERYIDSPGLKAVVGPAVGFYMAIHCLFAHTASAVPGWGNSVDIQLLNLWITLLGCRRQRHVKQLSLVGFLLRGVESGIGA